VTDYAYPQQVVRRLEIGAIVLALIAAIFVAFAGGNIAGELSWGLARTSLAVVVGGIAAVAARSNLVQLRNYARVKRQLGADEHLLAVTAGRATTEPILGGVTLGVTEHRLIVQPWGRTPRAFAVPLRTIRGVSISGMEPLRLRIECGDLALEVTHAWRKSARSTVRVIEERRQ
jgi:hypothetical protein